MKRIKSLLPEYWDSHEKQFNVLIVTDDESLERSGFLRHIISKRLMVGDIISIDKGTSADIRNKVVAEANPELDLIIVFSRGIYDNNPLDIIRNLNATQHYADTIDTPIVIFSIPTLRYISKKTDISPRWTEQIRKKLNSILINKFGAIDISHTDRDEYFKDDGQTLSMLGHVEFYKLLRDKVKTYNIDLPSISKDSDNFKVMLNKVQIKLLDLGYKIKQSEISNKIYGSTTKTAVKEIIKLLGYPPTEQLTKSIADAILLLDQLPSGQITVDTEKDISILSCDNPLYPGARERYHPSKYTGTNGIESNFNLRTWDGTTLNYDASVQFEKMMNAMKAAGITPFGTPGGWRTYETQYDIVDWDLYECSGRWRKKGSNGTTVVAEPGHSNHGKGEAIDVSGAVAQAWIKENGPKFGWYWGEAPSESWHFTFNWRGKWDKALKDDEEEDKSIVDKGWDMAKEFIPQLKVLDEAKEFVPAPVRSIFDHKNPKHIGILREELKRAKRIMQEYSDTDQNNNGYPDDTESASPQLTKQELDSIDRDAWTYIRGILRMINDPERYRNTDDLKKFVAQRVGASTIADDVLKNQLIRYALNGVKAVMQLNLDVQRKLDQINPLNFSASMPKDLPDSLRVRKTPWGDYSGD